MDAGALPPLEDAAGGVVTGVVELAVTGGVVEAMGGIGDGVIPATETFLTVTIDTLIAKLPATSRAIAVSVCAPFENDMVFHTIEYGGVVSSIILWLMLSTLNCTAATAMLSPAFAANVTLPETVVPFGGVVMEMVGGMVSIEDVPSLSGTELGTVSGVAY